ncbi:hypothetical protein YC2023_110361 [Brassica napus]
MEEYRFEKSEIQASFMMSTQLWSESWSLCNAADCAGNIQIQHVAGIMYVALPKVEMNQPGNLVGVEVAGYGIFAALSSSLLSGEPPYMVNDVILELFVSTGLLIQSQRRTPYIMCMNRSKFTFSYSSDAPRFILCMYFEAVYHTSGV